MHGIKQLFRVEYKQNRYRWMIMSILLHSITRMCI